MPTGRGKERIYRYRLRMTSERVKEQFEKARDRMIAAQARPANGLAAIAEGPLPRA